MLLGFCGAVQVALGQLIGLLGELFIPLGELVAEVVGLRACGVGFGLQVVGLGA